MFDIILDVDPQYSRCLSNNLLTSRAMRKLSRLRVSLERTQTMCSKVGLAVPDVRRAARRINECVTQVPECLASKWYWEYIDPVNMYSAGSLL